MSSREEDIFLDSGETSTTSYKNNPAFFMDLERTKGVGSLPAFSDFVYHGEIGSQLIYARVCTHIPHRLKRSPSSADRPLGRWLENVTAQDCTQILFIMTENVTLFLSQSWVWGPQQTCPDVHRHVFHCLLSTLCFFPPSESTRCVSASLVQMFFTVFFYTLKKSV